MVSYKSIFDMTARSARPRSVYVRASVISFGSFYERTQIMLPKANDADDLKIADGGAK